MHTRSFTAKRLASGYLSMSADVFNSHHREPTTRQSGPVGFLYKRGSLSGVASGWLSTMPQAILSSISAPYPDHQVQVNVHVRTKLNKVETRPVHLLDLRLLWLNTLKTSRAPP